MKPQLKFTRVKHVKAYEVIGHFNRVANFYAYRRYPEGNISKVHISVDWPYDTDGYEQDYSCEVYPEEYGWPANISDAEFFSHLTKRLDKEHVYETDYKVLLMYLISHGYAEDGHYVIDS